MRYRSGLLAVIPLVLAAPLAAQTRIVTGRVNDSLTTQPVTSGQVTVAGTTIGTNVKDDGTFTLAVPARDVTLTVRSIGFKRKDVALAASQNSVVVGLERDYFQLEAIVVTGQATGVEKRNLANAVATVDAQQLVRTSTTTVEQALQGKLAGANILSNGGGPGGGMVVQLRGVTSVLGNYTPLYVIDGVIMSDAAIPPGMDVITRSSGAVSVAGTIEMPINRVADLNPNDIENIEVLKGAAASAIYGSKASNGVILITTKRGRVGAPQFTVTQRVGVSMLSRSIAYRRFESQADAIAAFGPTGGALWAPGVYFNHEDELFGRKPVSYETVLSASGGSETTRYFASGLIKRDGGIMTGTWSEKQSVRLNIDQDIGARLKIGASAQVLHTSTSRGIVGNDNAGTSPADALHHTPSFFDLRQRADGTWPRNPFAGSNSLETVAKLTTDEDIWRSILAGNMSLDLVRGSQHTLRLVSNGGTDFFNQGDFIYSPPDLQYEPADGLAGTVANSQSRNLNLNLNTNLVHTFRPNSGSFTATTSLGVQYEQRELRISRNVTQNLIGTLSNIQRGTAFRVEEQHEFVRDAGAFMQEEVLIKERLLLTAGLRADKSSNNADTDKLFFYPKGSVSYRFTSPLPLVDELKFRGAYGQSGNLPQYGQKFTELNGVNVTGIPATVIRGIAGATAILPERQREIEFGLDAQMFRSRTSLEATVYEKRISDLLLQRTLVPSVGFTQQNLNGGVMRTRGLELGLTVIPIQSSSIQWSSRANFSLSRCKILSLPVPTFRLSSLVAGSAQIEAGQSCTQVIGNDTTAAGQRQLNVKIGDRNPTYLLGYSNDISYKALRLYFLFDYRQGGLMGDGTTRHFEVSKNNQAYCETSTPQGECIGAYRNRAFYTSLSTRAYVRSTTFVKLREATLTLDLPRSFTQSIVGGIRFARLTLSGRDLLVFTKWLGYDPEINQTPRSVAPAADLAPYPPSRTFWFSIDLGF